MYVFFYIKGQYDLMTPGSGQELVEVDGAHIQSESTVRFGLRAQV